ncbi:hypothetical protein [Uliginosibacterium aquaticum]|uniref:Lipoprotein n=1 Tax=Uliginosibacterium aquaticum TaxID=2731212 RepID=A0ABX2IJC2_9RHOO|nr:hypothetical protein [Uliginosibacterium aquaticum]NSL54729.1 hypothetical protein [Uliginosibacterium aquaticum]
MRTLKSSSVVLLLPLLAACVASTTPRTDEQFGTSLNSLKAMQTSNPAASLDSDPVRGVDGKAAGEAMRNYNESFRQPAPTGMQTPSSGGTGSSGGSTTK